MRVTRQRSPECPDTVRQHVRSRPGLALRALVRHFDRFLRRVYGIHEFSDSAECLLRIAVSRSNRAVRLGDGTAVACGELIGELHLWNEHVPPLPETGPDLSWALMFRHRLRNSLTELARYVDTDPRLRSVRAFRGEGVLGSQQERERLAQMARTWGFDVPLCREYSWAHAWTNFWRNVYTWALLWAFNCGSTRRDALRGLRRAEFWISRRALARYREGGGTKRTGRGLRGNPFAPAN